MPPPPRTLRSGQAQNPRAAFAAMTGLFFLWGFLTVFNDVLIPRFKAAFTLDYFHAMLVQFAFFGAYFIGAAAYFGLSVLTGDPIARLGYRRGVIGGLLLASAGSLIFWPASTHASYGLFLLALFVVGLGFALLQIAATPYVTLLGPESTASSRLNLAQGFNSLGTTIGPAIAGYLIVQYFARTGAHGAESVRVPYLAFGVCFALFAVVFARVPLPESRGEAPTRGAGALRHPHLVLGIVAIFMYVGGEVSIGSTLISFLGQRSIAGLTALEASRFVSLYWGGLLIGRFMAAAGLSELPGERKRLLLVAIPAGAALALFLIGRTALCLPYLPFLAACCLGFQAGGGIPGRTLTLFSLAVSALLAVAIFSRGSLAMWCVVAVGLFTSIGWSNTFSLAIEGTGADKSQASSLLVMGILGGALLPPLQGWLADRAGLSLSFVVPLVAYLYVAFYGALGCRIGRRVSTGSCVDS